MTVAQSTAACPGCGAVLPDRLLACPGCGTLVHGGALKELAAAAVEAEQRQDLAVALSSWRQVLQLLPPGSTQHQRVLGKVTALSALVPAGAVVTAAPGAPPSAAPTGQTNTPPPGRSRWGRWAAGLGAFGVLLAKLKWVLLFALAKGKVLLVGLTQAKTFLTMAIAVGVYTMAFGWKFAVGLIVSIYVHEMGHVVWLRRYGIAATAPVFIPGFGAFVRLKQHPATVGEDARVGLAGPIWGAGAALVALAVGAIFHLPIFLAIARVGAWINLFNLVPVWQLDGGRGFAALSRQQRGFAAAVLWLLALSGADGVLFILAIGATFRAATSAPGSAPAQGDGRVLATYVALVVGLTILMSRVGGR